MSDRWKLYVLECKGGVLYTGISTDIQRRLEEHKTGRGARFTRSYPPVQIIGVKAFPDRSSASKAEAELKKKTPAQKREWAGEHEFSI